GDAPDHQPHQHPDAAAPHPHSAAHHHPPDAPDHQPHQHPDAAAPHPHSAAHHHPPDAPDPRYDRLFLGR
ncbi:hypothetical protein AB0H41_34450, partial [Streptomyces wuyuanensis]